MLGKSSVSRKTQQGKRNPKRKLDDEETKLPEKEVKKAVKSKNHTEHLSPGGQANLKRVKISVNKRRTWQPLSSNTREHLQTVMESVIIAILSKSIKDKEQIQYHLNFLKKRLLHLYETLKAPSKKLKDLTNVPDLLRMERAREKVNEEGLTSLQEEIDKIVENAEVMTGNIQSLKKKIQILANEVEEEEQKMLQMGASGVLSLPQLPQDSLKAPTLQKEILTLIPNQDALLKDLHVLHHSSQVKNMLTFIEEAYKKLDAS
ncbi:centromere protein Q [Ochotona princeps]|uniref:centromere protein Q n=1 Tax=Ochotona princeps TaxID=9978 RepID=UPI0027149859|nr:centromere protein Q [Ochotona princeps]